MSVRLTTSLSQRLVLTPQLRQRIEMLQMTALELTDLIQQQMLENPVLEEVTTQEEAQELAEKIIDHLASEASNNLDAATAEAGEYEAASSNGSGDLEAATTYVADTEPSPTGEAGATEFEEDSGADEAARDSFEEIDFGREFQDYLDPGYKTQEFEYKEDAPTFEQFLTRGPSLSEHLEWQLHLSTFKEVVCDAALSVIGYLDEDGWLNDTN